MNGLDRERERLREAREHAQDWRMWGPYLSDHERACGTKKTGFITTICAPVIAARRYACDPSSACSRWSRCSTPRETTLYNRAAEFDYGVNAQLE
jgi:hypothetical protein